MTSRDFCYWLQGFFEIGQGSDVAPNQVEVIKNHLKMVFIHEIDPLMGPPPHQEKLQKAHDATTSTPEQPKHTGPDCFHDVKMRC